jgi:5-formyltetrahydrofolate cyclo-ligase
MEPNVKNGLRQELLQRRRAMAPEEWLLKSGKVLRYLKGFDPLIRAARVHCYVSMECEREVSTLPLLAWLCSERKEVYMPYIDRGEMRVARYHPGQLFEARRSGPPSPDPLSLTDEIRFDVVIVPLVGADRSGARIGYGKGWYDRFFESLLAEGVSPVRIGIGFGFQVVGDAHPDPWDQYLDVVVTENGIINCRDARS